MAESVEQAATLQVTCKRRAKRTTALPTENMMFSDADILVDEVCSAVH
jgi:hypothetical protein